MVKAPEEQSLYDRVKNLKGAELISFVEIVNKKLEANIDAIKKTMAEETDEKKRTDFKNTINDTVTKIQEALKNHSHLE